MCLQVYPLKEYASGLTHEQMLSPTTKQDNFTFHSPLPKSQIGFCNCILKSSMQHFLELLCVKNKTVHVRTEINKNKKHVITIQFCPIFEQVLAQSLTQIIHFTSIEEMFFFHQASFLQSSVMQQHFSLSKVCIPTAFLVSMAQLPSAHLYKETSQLKIHTPPAFFSGVESKHMLNVYRRKQGLLVFKPSAQERCVFCNPDDEDAVSMSSLMSSRTQNKP